MSKFLLPGLEAPSNQRPSIRSQAAGVMITPTQRHFHDLWVPQGGMTNCSENLLSGGLGLGFERYLMPKAFKAFDVVTRHSFRVQAFETIVSSIPIDFH